MSAAVGMSTLLLDVGNTRLKWAWLDPGGDPVDHGASARDAPSLADTLRDTIATRECPTRVVGCCVRRVEVEAEIAAWVRVHCAVEVEWMPSRASGWGVSSAYAEPTTLGADRWAKLVAARALAPAGACIVDCGTAITVDALAADGRHLGGAILPGVDLMRRSLATSTARIGQWDGQPVEPLGRSTRDAVLAGTTQAAVGAVDRLYRAVVEQTGAGVAYLVTGGGAAAMCELLDPVPELCPDLVLRGVARMAREAP
ncbi:MAG: type III pantothenate kinase [Ectothiorhodospiraceae bacterium]|nr:type III pantothenate kinase [Ectothiorhodospiraceae bacterium]